MKQFVRTLLLGTAMVAGSATWAAAQAVVQVQWGGYHDSDDRQAFRDGYRQGQWDARQGRRSDWDDHCRYREADDRQAFRNGYNRGYREVGYRRGDGDGDADDGYYGNRGPYGGYGNGPYGGYGNGSNVAERFGFQDGLNAGAYDRQTGHSYRPEHDGGYKHADNGYDSRFGSKDNYKYYYRQAYMRGYQQGYNSGGGGWRRY